MIEEKKMKMKKKEKEKKKKNFLRIKDKMSEKNA